MPKIEILHVRDPDQSCVHTVFVDGVEVSYGAFTMESVDAGAGGSRKEWNEHTEFLRNENPEGHSPAFLEATLEARAEDSESKYLDDDDSEW